MSRASSVQLTAAACALCSVFAFPSAGRAQDAPRAEGPPNAPPPSAAAPSPAEKPTDPAPVNPAPASAATNPAPTNPPPAPVEPPAQAAVPSAPGNTAPTRLEAPSAPPPSKTTGPVQARIYGFLNAQLERVWARGGSTPYDPRFRVTDGGSRLGFDGAIQIGARTKAVWQIEGSLNGFEQAGVSDQGTPAIIVSRNTFVGVDDERFGRLIAGNVDSAYRSLIGSGGAMGGNLGLTTLGLDLWNNTSAQLTGAGANIFSRGEARYQNSLHYFTPAWPLPPNGSSIRGAASYSFDETLANGRRRDRFSLAALYQVAGLSLGVGLDYQANTGINVDNWQQGLGAHTDAEDGPASYFYKAVASYLFPSRTYLGAGFERSNYGYLLFTPPSSTSYYSSLSRGTLRQNGAMASLAQGIGHATLMASAGALFRLDHTLYGRGRDFQATQYSLGAKYDFNELFAGYAFFTAIRNQAQQDVNLGMPIYSNNFGTNSAYMALGDSPRSLGIGIVARF